MTVDLTSKGSRKHRRKDPIIRCPKVLKETGEKPDWNDISAQGNELKSYWAQWESMMVNQKGLFCWKLIGPGSSSMMQVVIPLSLVEMILELLHDNETTDHMGAQRSCGAQDVQVVQHKNWAVQGSTGQG